VRDLCAWRAAGYPAYDGPPRRGQTYAGTDRQCRGRLLGVLRDAHARELPWRERSASPWAVMVSEFMLQQTPVSRVLPVYEQWMERWPTPAHLAAARSGDAVRAWGRLGYPRRALRLHQAATAIVERHDGEVPHTLEALRALPGVGEYTAAAVATFAYGRRHSVLDTNVRRVLARVVGGVEYPANSVTRAERELADGLLPGDDVTAAAWAVGVMELGALVCTATSPSCGGCPVRDLCAWRAAGYPAYDGPPRRGQTYAGTDRQCRGRLLGVLRDAHEPVHRSRLDAVWDDDLQRTRCLAGLVEDGLAVRTPRGTYALP
jgi:A/G-specific adenine glycosylase